LREVIAAYHRTVADVVRSFDGYVAKYMGDGVLVYFGYPRAHEDDAERAVRAGLNSIEAVGRLDVVSAKLQARVGIATGLVVVGDLIGEGAAQEQSVVGETPNLAARLQAAWADLTGLSGKADTTGGDSGCGKSTTGRCVLRLISGLMAAMPARQVMNSRRLMLRKASKTAPNCDPEI
jgi:hypothetical protein